MEVANTAPITPLNLITNVFLGEGVEVLDVQYSGSAAAVGFFKDGENAVNISRGIVMSTGFAVSGPAGVGVEGLGTQQSSSATSGPAFDPDMLQIAGGNPIHDMVSYTITFIPISDTLRFRYVFASEEYPEFVCTPYNDIFGFFISGPGINGPYTNGAMNIARVPGTNLPVTINNVNPGQVGSSGGAIANCTPPNGSLAYSEFYNSNSTPTQPVFDGYTDVFMAEAIVVPCSTYTIKLVICDVSDSGWDSGVFLEARSFGTGSLKVDVATASLDGSIAEGCSEGLLSFSLPFSVENDYPIDYTIFGTAENGVDYSLIPPGLFIPAGDSTVSIPLIAFEDDMPEGVETLMIDIQRDVCNRDTIMILIKDNPLVPADLGADVTLCQGDTILLDGTLDVPLPEPLTFHSQDTIVILPAGVTLYSNIQVAGVLPPTLGPGVIQSVCIDDLRHRWVDDMRMYLLSPGGQFMELVTDIGNPGDDFIGTCFTPTAVRPITTATLADQPFTGEWLPEGLWDDLYGESRPTNGIWRLSLFDKFAPDIGTLNRWSITFNPIYEIQYDWQPAAGLSCTDCPAPLAFPDTTTTYVMTATDSYGCQTSDTITIEVLPALAAPQLSCAVITNNSITIAWPAVPGAGAYEVNVDNTGWQPVNGQNQHTVGGLPLSTAMNFRVRALGQCPGFEATIECATPDCTPAEVVIGNIVDASCFGSADGSLSILASGGTAPYTFVLGNETSNDGFFTSLLAGVYTIQVIDSTGCPGTTQATVGQPEALQAQAIVADVSCFGLADGTAAFEVMGGSGPFVFSWSDGQTDSLAVGLAAGQYTVDVLDANGCSITYSTEVSQPDELSLLVAIDSVQCNGQADGRAQVSVIGGTPNYEYTFSMGATVGPSPNEAINLTAGPYSVVVTDANGCQQSGDFLVEEPVALQVEINTTDVLCAGGADGSAAAVVSGGSGPYSFRWENESGQAISLDAVAASLPAGVYTLHLQDRNACLLEETVGVDEPDSLLLQATVQAASCQGVADGAISLEVTGGIPDYIYTWSDIGNAAASRSGLGAGTYQVVVADANGCERVLDFAVDSPQALALVLEASPASCFGFADGQALVEVSGGTGDYTYLWSNGQEGAVASGLAAGTVSVFVEDSNGCEISGSISIGEPPALALDLTAREPACFGSSDGTISAMPQGGVGGYLYAWSNGQTSPDASGLPAGLHTVTVTDANGCEITNSIALSQPQELTSTMAAQTASCLPTPDGSATISGQGGTPPYSYLWSNGAQAATAQGLAAGQYTVTLTDANGCTLSDTALVEGIPPINLLLTFSNVSCQGGSDGRASVVASGGSGDYTYLWGNGLADNSEVNGLLAGNYNLLVTDALGCTATASFFVSQPPALVADTEMDMVSCSGGADGRLRLQPRGGTPPYSAVWSTGATGSLLDGLSVGNYSATVTDALGCTAFVAAVVIEARPVDITLEIGAVKCYGESTGGARALVSGGVAPYSYQWSTGASTAVLEAAPSGDYTLSITDAAGCELIEEIFIPQPEAPLSAAVKAFPVSCFGADDGRLELTAAGGTPGYRYSLDGQNYVGSSAFIRMKPGIYRPMLEDANGCRLTLDQAAVREPVPILVDLGGTQSVDYGASLTMYPDIQGGQGSLSYEWFPQDSSLLSCFDCLNPIVTPPYQIGLRLIVTDANNCRGEGFVNLYARKDRPILVPTGFTPNGDNYNDILLVHARQDVEVRILTFRVFDRWGELLFEAADFAPNDSTIGWDGTFRGQPTQAGVYIWEALVEYPDKEQRAFNGNTTLIR